MSVPDLRHVINDVRQRYPEAWQKAHTSAPKAQAELFVRLVAWALHQVDPRVGLNGKRGNPNDLSQDVILFKLDDTRRQGVDFIGGAGGANPTIVWNVFPEPGTDQTGYWVAPREVSQTEYNAILGLTAQPPPPSTAPRTLLTFRVHDRYLCAEQHTGLVVCNREATGAWEGFAIDRTDPSHGRLTTSFGTQLLVVGNTLHCTAKAGEGTIFGIWEREGQMSFQVPSTYWVRIGDAAETFALTVDGPHVDEHGQIPRAANGDPAPGAWETFTVGAVTLRD